MLKINGNKINKNKRLLSSVVGRERAIWCQEVACSFILENFTLSPLILLTNSIAPLKKIVKVPVNSRDILYSLNLIPKLSLVPLKQMIVLLCFLEGPQDLPLSQRLS